MITYNSIKEKIFSYDQKRWWGDDVDIRFHLIFKIKNIKNKKILDVGGGIGIISAELDITNLRVNADSNFNDLIKCKKDVDTKIQGVCCFMLNLPFKDNVFDLTISASSLQYAKNKDLKEKQFQVKNDIKKYPSVQKSLHEIYRTLKNEGKLILVTPNNLYYQTYMLNYHELKSAIKEYFPNFSLKFYNTFPKLSSKYRKMNLANSIPKIMLKIKNPVKVFSSLIKDDDGNARYSVSFYLEAIKNQ